ncbi:pentapeptide repeat-containing protein [Aggregatilinea lenta]|uniref:pentapeptide repeat-containing protein n=1 Tax=Aggregatilinea lenta TaxID=913108 RepID=UPI001EE854AF|nr:pentapeptide repeat-containing protein [Aggregatilinea lenta]
MAAGLPILAIPIYYEIKSSDPDFIRLNVFVLLIVLDLTVISATVKYKYEDRSGLWIFRWFGDLSHEFAGALILSALAFLLITMPEQQAQNLQHKAELIRDLGSSERSVSSHALQEIKVHGWHQDGSLNDAYLFGTDLSGLDLSITVMQRANLGEANLQKTGFWGADLQRAFFIDANLVLSQLGATNLRGALLSYADLEDAELNRSDLRGASLVGANLRGASFLLADLSNVDLTGANLEGVRLDGTTRFDENTILPDGTHWSPDTDMARFTDPSHPAFWYTDHLYTNPNWIDHPPGIG